MIIIIYMRRNMIMKCQKCQSNHATINMSVQMNQQRMQMRVCQSCFQELKGQINGSNPEAFSNHFFQANGSSGPQMRTKQQTAEEDSILDQLGKNISHDAQSGAIDPVIGRDGEVKRVIETLNRRNKNNRVLIGEPGVGKTAIAEGLAVKIAEGDVPAKLLNKQVYLLDVSSLVANTGIRGQFEERMNEIIDEVKSREDVILFVDEIHLLVGAGTAEGSQMDAGNILKPALARGEMQLIGATTLKEYRQIEKDAALERRFQPIIVKEPTIEETILILQGLKDRYEKFHEVSYTDDVIESFATLSSRYIQDRFLPDKAIDLMDEVGSRINLAHAEKDTATLENQLENIVKEKEEAAEQENYELAANLRYQEIQLQKQLEKAKESTQEISS